MLQPERVLIAAVFDAAGMDAREPIVLFTSLALMGGHAARCRRRLYHVGSLDSTLVSQLRALSVETMKVPPVDGRIPHLNKLHMFQSEPDVDVVLGLDTDIAVLGDPLPWLHRDAVAAKPVDRDVIPIHDWAQLFAMFGLGVPRERHLTTFHGTPTIAYYNSGVVAVPAEFLDALREEWLAVSDELLRRQEQLPASIQRERFHTDQFALAIALHRRELPVRALPITMNFPTNAPVADLFDPDALAPILLHHHHQLGHASEITLPSHAAAAGRVAHANSLMAHGEARLPRPQGPKRGAPVAVGARTDRAPSGEFNNEAFWNARYRDEPDRGSGLGSRGQIALAKRALIQRVIDAFSPDSLLDVGCGDLASIRGLSFDGSYTGIDISSVVLDRNRSMMPEGTFVLADLAAGIPDRLAPAELVLCFDVLIHQHDRPAYQQLVGNVVRLTKKVALISGYETNPTGEFASDITAYHEPLSVTLARHEGVEASHVTSYRGTSVFLVRRGGPG